MRGFTLIELLVVLALISTLLMLVAPRFTRSVDHSKEVVLRENLYLIRKAIDQYFADTGGYPNDLQALVEKKYLRRPPLDPLTGRADTWIIVPPADGQPGGVFDVRSGAPGQADDGAPYASW